MTIHDLIKHESRGVETTTRFPLIYWLKFFIYRLIAWATIKKAAKIITPSFFWQKEPILRKQLPKEKIVVTYEGFNENLSRK
ncbi:MAG TPA: hypothetical protein PLZ32_14430, partial [Saprospiraceae bacterium]|nr:hypothetical protein [Saprospiraceae bacterium]